MLQDERDAICAIDWAVRFGLARHRVRISWNTFCWNRHLFTSYWIKRWNIISNSSGSYPHISAASGSVRIGQQTGLLRGARIWGTFLKPRLTTLYEVAWTFLKRKYGQDVELYGGLGSQSTIPNDTVDDCLKGHTELLYKGGGYIYGPTGAVPTDAPLENVVAIIEYAKNGYR